MAGGTGAGAAAIGLDPAYTIVARAFHHGHAGFHLNRMLFAAKFYISDLCHGAFLAYLGAR